MLKFPLCFKVINITQINFKHMEAPQKFTPIEELEIFIQSKWLGAK